MIGFPRQIKIDELRGRLEGFVFVWLGFGFLILLVGMFYVPSRGGYKTLVYLTMILPSCILLVVSGLASIRRILTADICLMVALSLYLSMSSLWGDGDVGEYLKASAVLFLAWYGVCRMVTGRAAIFVMLLKCSVVLVAFVSCAWIVHYYLMLDFPFSRRFLSGSFTEFGFYDERHYGAFFNPLLLGHCLLFCLGVVGFLVSARIVSAWWTLLAIPVLLLLILAQSRMACITAFLLSVFYFLRWGGWRAVVLLGLVGVLLVFFVNIDLVVARGLSYRPQIWGAALEGVMSRPLFGYGMGAYTQLCVLDAIRCFNEPHNIGLSVLYYGGGVAVFLLVLLLGSIVRGWHYINMPNQIWFVTWSVVLAMGGMVDGDGLLDRPDEHWFNIYLPLFFLMTTRFFRPPVIS